MLHTVTNHGPNDIQVMKMDGAVINLLPRQSVTVGLTGIASRDGAHRYSVQPSNLFPDLRKAEVDRVKEPWLLGILVLNGAGAAGGDSEAEVHAGHGRILIARWLKSTLITKNG